MNLTEKQLRKLVQSELELNEGLFDFEDSQVLKALGLAPEKQKQIDTSQDSPPVSANEEGRLKVIEMGLDVNSSIHDIIYDHCYNANVIIGTLAGVDIRFRDKAAKFGSTELTDDDLRDLRISKIDEFKEEYFKDFDLDGDNEIADIGDYEIALLSELKPRFEKIKSDIEQEIRIKIAAGYDLYLKHGHAGPIEDFLLGQFDSDKKMLNGQYSFENDTIIFRKTVGIIVPKGGSDAFYNKDTIDSWASDPMVIKNETEKHPYFYSIVGVMIEIAFDDFAFEDEYKFDDKAYERAYFAEIQRQERVAKAKGQDPRLINTRKIAQKLHNIYKPALNIRSASKKLPYAFKDFRYNVFYLDSENADMGEIDRDLGGMDNVYDQTFLAWEKYKLARAQPLTQVRQSIAKQATAAAKEDKFQQEQQRLRDIGLQDPDLKAQVPREKKKSVAIQSLTGKTISTDIEGTIPADKPVEKSIAKKVIDAIPFKRTDYLLTDDEILARKEQREKEAEKKDLEKRLLTNTGTFFRNEKKINDDKFRKSMHEAIREIVRGQFAKFENDLVENLTILKKFYGPKSYISFPKSLMAFPSGDQKLSIINLSEEDYSKLTTAATVLTTYLSLLQEEILDEFRTNFFKHPDGEITYGILFNSDRTKLIKNALLPEYVPLTLLKSLDSTLTAAVNDQFAKLCEKVYNIPDFYEKKGNDTATFQEQIKNLKNLLEHLHDIREDQTFIRQRAKAAKRDQMLRRDLTTSVQGLKQSIKQEFEELVAHDKKMGAHMKILGKGTTEQVLRDAITKMQDGYVDRPTRDKMKRMRNLIRAWKKGRKPDMQAIINLANEVLDMSAALNPETDMVVKENLRITLEEIRNIIRSELI